MYMDINVTSLLAVGMIAAVLNIVFLVVAISLAYKQRSCDVAALCIGLAILNMGLLAAYIILSLL